MENLREKLGKNITAETYFTLKSFLTEQGEGIFDKNTIVSLKDITPLIEGEVNEIVDILERYINNKYKDMGYNFRGNSMRGCYFLSTLFALTSDWELVQGQMRLEGDDKLYHSWLRKGDIIYDPAFKLITRKSKYDLLFKQEEVYTKEELKNLFKRTATFTYYKKDLEDGSIMPEAYLMLYDTEQAKEIGEEVIQDLEDISSELELERLTLNGSHYTWDDIDVTDIIREKLIHMAYVIAAKENISFKEAYIKFYNSEIFKVLEKLENGLWTRSYKFIENEYFTNEYFQKKK